MKCIHCGSGIVLHDDGMHRSLGWEVPCQREMTEEEAALMWKALTVGGQDIEPATECTCGGSEDQPADHHDISCPKSIEGI